MAPQKVIVAPSLLAANPGRYEDEIRDLESKGADWLHIDVMDGSFVPSITFGDNIVRMAKGCSKLFMDVHLMIQRPEAHIDAFKQAGTDRLIIHQEVSPHLYRVLNSIRSAGMANGVAINPGTPAETLFSVLEVSDLALVMTVNPGWGGQSFLPMCLKKIETLRKFIDSNGLKTVIEVDGGINAETGKRCVEAGASVLVAGTYVLGATDRSAAIKSLR